MGCCLVGAIAAFFPRLVLVAVWLSTSLVSKAFSNWLWPLLGLIFLPFTAVAYVFAHEFAFTAGAGSGVHGALTGTGWVMIGIGLLLDLGTHGGGVLSRRKSAQR
ncbi:hypothetical protein BIV57_05550 [Mangrovactinospora gilvigrisea]|uniref:Uncharacterized protein n=1 Tax=Mangrovactinospora gilvigrisea TaxID=1428644 RepID=A0A1J7CAC8_9ACTN|nr:hypothetical protein [Mangrovactinospora gilvigrisea]OIV38468.1 hypothetical protein BIV57_05550 [Mangrovactinospora gilvigrisea]